jgi:thiamine pyrophosphokinase
MKITIPQCTVVFQQAEAKAVVLVAGGRAPAASWLASMAQLYPIWAVDRGADTCRAAAVTPEILLGDADSSAASSWQWLEALQVPTVRYPADKDFTDLQLALRELSERRPGAAVLLTGGWGGRFDHAWANVFSLLQAVDAGLNIAGIVDQAEVMFFLAGGQQLEIEFTQTPKTISLIPFTPVCRQVTSQGVHWPLAGVNLSMQAPAAISNRLAVGAQKIRVSLGEGMLGIYCCWQETGL